MTAVLLLLVMSMVPTLLPSLEMKMTVLGMLLFNTGYFGDDDFSYLSSFSSSIKLG